MPKYFFHVRDGFPLIQDHVGVELPDLAAAREQGHRVAETVVGGLIEKPELFSDLRVDICDAAGNTLQRVELPTVAAFRR